MYLRYLKFEFFEIRPHPRISLALARYAVAVDSRSAALVYEKHSCLVNCMYLYVLVRTFQEILYWYVSVSVCTGMYRYVPVHTLLPDPVQVYRIPDGIFEGADGVSALWTALYYGQGEECPSLNEHAVFMKFLRESSLGVLEPSLMYRVDYRGVTQASDGQRGKAANCKER
jgi:hypothetical protein